MNKKEYGLVLSGGGTRGAFQVGVWKALKELEIDVRDIVKLNNFNQYIAGSKVGALGENALEKENVNKVIQLLRKRIEEETAI